MEAFNKRWKRLLAMPFDGALGCILAVELSLLCDADSLWLVSRKEQHTNQPGPRRLLSELRLAPTSQPHN